MSFLTDEERIDLLMSAMTSLGRLYQDLAHAPALTLAYDSEVKKSKKIRQTMQKNLHDLTVRQILFLIMRRDGKIAISPGRMILRSSRFRREIQPRR